MVATVAAGRVIKVAETIGARGPRLALPTLPCDAPRREDNRPSPASRFPRGPRTTQPPGRITH